jgi:hypothetical protein
MSTPSSANKKTASQEARHGESAIIARKAWEKLSFELLTHHNLDGKKYEQGIAIIQSAIDEAVEADFHRWTDIIITARRRKKA